MYENHKQPIKPRSEFTKRQIKNIVLGLLITFASLFIGMWGYHYFESMDWTDAYVNAAMILAGMGPVDTLKTDSGRLFAGTYALFSGVIFLVILAVVLAPSIHRVLHQFHFDDK